MKNKKRELLPVKKDVAGPSGNLFVRQLLIWNNKSNTRKMPWKGEKDAYKIWLSEIILQQTRVEQGMKYYENFIKAFPDVQALADAPEEKVFKLWEGLGYYSRCRNLIKAAKYIAKEFHGVFPQDYDSILQLKGVGSYTASAIASFAYNLPYAVLDGNVFRVLSRIFEIDKPIDSTEGKKYFSGLAQDLLPDKKAGEYNQAIMDFGAVICKPYPQCAACFFRKYCKAYQQGKQELLPRKEKQVKIRERWLNYFVVKYKGQVLVRQRTSKDIWQQLFEFVPVESDKSYKAQELLELFKAEYGISSDRSRFLQKSRQKLSHQVIHFSFTEIELGEKESIQGFSWLRIPELDNYAFPKMLQKFVTAHLK